MEADWEVEIGPAAPILDALWPGFVDLRDFPERIGDLGEAQCFPALAEALLRLNGPDSEDGLISVDKSAIWTSKCDIWRLDTGMEQFDPDEMDADPTECLAGVGCYIYLLPRDGVAFAELGRVEEWVAARVDRIRQIAVRRCRADLVIRRAFVGEREGLCVTAYLTACGVTAAGADEALGCALAVFAKAISETTRIATSLERNLRNDTIVL